MNARTVWTLAVTLVAVLLAAAAPAAAQGPPIGLKVASLPIGDLGAFFYAIEQGVFAKHGLKVQNVSTAGGAAAIAAMTGGEIDMAYTNNVSVILAASEGLPIVIVCGANDNQPDGPSDMASFVVPKDIEKPAELAGKTIASNALNNINWLYARAWLREQGVNPERASYVEVPFPEQPAAVLQGRIQGTLIPEPFRTRVVDGGARSLGNPYRIRGGRTFISSFVATPTFVQKNPDAAQRFCDAYGDAVRQTRDKANLDKLHDAIAKNTRLERAAMTKITLPRYSSEVPKTLLESMGQVMIQEGLLKKTPDLDRIIWKKPR